MTNAEALRESVANQLRARQHLCWSQLVISRFAAIGKVLHPPSNENPWLYSLHASQVDAWILKTAVLQLTQMKIFARPVQTPIGWFSLSAQLSAQLSPLPVHSTSHEIVFRAPLPYVIIYVNCAKTYIHYNNVDFRHEMRVKLVHAHCFSLVFNKMLIENAPSRLPNV